MSSLPEEPPEPVREWYLEFESEVPEDEVDSAREWNRPGEGEGGKSLSTTAVVFSLEADVGVESGVM